MPYYHKFTTFLIDFHSLKSESSETRKRVFVDIFCLSFVIRKYSLRMREYVRYFRAYGYFTTDGIFFVLLSITYVRGHLRLRNFINIIIYLLFQSEDGDHTHSHPTSLNKSVYDSLRQGGSTSLIESLQSQVYNYVMLRKSPTALFKNNNNK